ncbi:capsid protein [Chicken proventriculitis-associated circular virus 10]|nr:capsid protein [Chicken proventriculitis-associated circular virus 10]
MPVKKVAPRRKVYRPRKQYVKRKVSYKPRPSQSRYLAPALSSLGGVAGGMIGGPPGALLGSTMGGVIGETIKTLTGFGDYKIKSNTLAMGRPPQIHNKSKAGGSVIISHKEYIGDILSSSSANTFKIQKFPLQPGSDETFPWLSQIAANFQEYKFLGVIFHFRSMSADALNSTNTALGSVIMSTEYNALAPDFASKSEMENAQFSNSIKPSDSCLHLIECARQSSVLSNLYVRTDNVNSAQQDIRFYDLGNFYIASTGCQGTSVNLGELWVTYEVELYKPKLWAELGETSDFYNAYNITGVAAATPFGTSGTLVESANSNITISIDYTNRILTLPASSAPKSYLFRIYWRGTRTASLNPPGSTYTNANVVQTPFVVSSGLTQAAAVASPDSNVASLSLWLVDEIVFETSGNGLIPSITFDGAGTLPGSATIVNFQLIQIPNTYGF